MSCSIYIPLIYREERENTFKRLYEEINKALKNKSFPFITSAHEFVKYFTASKCRILLCLTSLGDSLQLLYSVLYKVQALPVKVKG